ncbi:hypothetical protein SAMN04487846_3438 [Microbacterium sp. cf046]|uniref:hypothetical protein n=1 Tax=Microbacterium sp. cf046 TaxID=1761803 RepID=UPI0008EF6944|nr:hypothetical protein [Microbacterium sp. cf046]SFS17060.1 hypothetical protein SAMN04487846_3438 [Microbacterium sp. cf046]
MTRTWPWILAWTIGTAALGWLSAAALLVSTVPACGWAVIDSGVVRAEVWANHRLTIVVTTLIALLWVVGCALWLKRTGRGGGTAAAALCVGFGAAAWVAPYLGLGYTIYDYWTEGVPLEGVPRFGDGPCGLDVSPLGAVLVSGGLVAMVGWVVYVITEAATDTSPVSEAIDIDPPNATSTPSARTGEHPQ